ncbi:hypothetical protein MPSEU_000033900 [Mayamaea pseudoterrestris]|nr:hypothetical protein MPSEU_000033900 [Mayamaea pseudoterrestris]
MSSSPVGLAIVGCGQIVTHHLAAIASLTAVENESSDFDGTKNSNVKMEIRALCDPSAKQRQAIAELPASQSLLSACKQPNQYALLNELIADTATMEQIQVIFIAVPHDLHETLALQALTGLGSGKMVVMEKPLAPTRDSCDKLVDASLQQLADAKAPMLVIAEQSPYWQEVQLAKRLIDENAIGTIVTAASYYYESMRTNATSGDVDESGGLGWRGSLARAGGGITIDGGLHWIRPLREMVGRIDEVVAVTRSGLQPQLKMEGETLAHAMFKIDAPCINANDNPLKQPNGSGPLVATYSCNMLATAPMAHDVCPFFRITGTQGEFIIHGDGLLKEIPGAGGLRLYNAKHPNGTELFSNDRQGGFFLGFAGLWCEIHRIFAKQDRKAAHETVVRAADDVRVALAMYKSAQTRQWEKT